MECAKTLGKKYASLKASDTERIKKIGYEVLSRPLNSKEVLILNNLLNKCKKYYKNNKQLCEKLTGKNDPYQASWIITARALLNLDEFLNRQ